MSRAKKIAAVQERYESFKNPYTAIATMIIVQAASDYAYLDGREIAKNGGATISKWEVINFFKSRWGAFLAESVDLPREAMLRYVE